MAQARPSTRVDFPRKHRLLGHGVESVSFLRGSYPRQAPRNRGGGGGGLPQWNCSCLNCVQARKDSDSALAESLVAIRLELANVQFYGWGHLNENELLPTREQAQSVIAAKRPDYGVTFTWTGDDWVVLPLLSVTLADRM